MHSVGMQLCDLGRDDDAAATAEYFDLFAAVFSKQIEHVFEILDVSALIGRDGNALHVFLQRGVHDFAYGPVMAEMNDFDTAA